jgi:hypothetical protein
MSEFRLKDVKERNLFPALVLLPFQRVLPYQARLIFHAVAFSSVRTDQEIAERS